MGNRVSLEVGNFLEAAPTLGTQAEEAVKTCVSPVGNQVSLEVSDFLEAVATLGTQVEEAVKSCLTCAKPGG